MAAQTSNSKIREIRLTNSLTQKKEILETLVPGKLSLYSCGPTVYDLIHIGNLRGALSSDMFYRYFKRVGYDVNYVRNYTDVDDKIIKRANDEKVDSLEISTRFIKEVEMDFAVAGLLEPTHKTLVREHMAEIVQMIGDILKNGKAYEIDGEVFFSISAFEGYGKLSHRNLEDLEAGARVEVNSKKKNPLDFSLWKPAKPGEPSWPSPWGNGRPGWHIECSAMASKWLGDRIDVHHGGEDLVFPHHENEIAQSEAACGKAPFVKYWLHHAFLTLSKEKMSKSLGNVFKARDFLTRFSGEFARYLLLSVHYRSLIDFSADAVENAWQGLHRIYEAKQRAKDLINGTARSRSDMRAEGMWGQFLADAEKTKADIDAAFANDFNSPAALGALFSLIREFNRLLSEPLAQATPSCVLGAQVLNQIIETDIGGILGFGCLTPEKGLEDLSRIRREEISKAVGGEAGSRPSAEEIQGLIDARLKARGEKNFAEADRIRKDLLARGVVLKDSPQGTTWDYS